MSQASRCAVPAPAILALALALALAAGQSAAAYTADTAGSDANGDAGYDAGFDARYDANYDPFAELGASRKDHDDSSDGSDATYRDRIIAPERLAALPADDDADTVSGAPRAMHVELTAHHTRFAGERSVELGAGFGGFRDTEQYGTLSADALLFRSDRGREDGARWRGSATLWQRGLQMPGGWSVNNGLGVLNTPMPGLLREQYRFFLPSVPMLGASSEWQQRARGLQI